MIGSVYQRVDGEPVIVLRVDALRHLVLLAGFVTMLYAIERLKRLAVPAAVEHLAGAVKLGPKAKLEVVPDARARSVS